jgi:hypothetical protein
MIAIPPDKTDPLRKTSVRLPPDQWRRVKDETLDLDATMNHLIVCALNLYFTQKGEPLLDPDCPVKPPKRHKRGDA